MKYRCIWCRIGIIDFGKARVLPKRPKEYACPKCHLPNHVGFLKSCGTRIDVPEKGARSK